MSKNADQKYSAFEHFLRSGYNGALAKDFFWFIVAIQNSVKK